MRRPGSARRLAPWALAPLVALLAACARGEGGGYRATGDAVTLRPFTRGDDGAPAVTVPPAVAGADPVGASPAAEAAPNAGAAGGGATDGAGAETGDDEAVIPHDPENRAEPAREGEELVRRAKHLFEALAMNDASLGEDFFLPKDAYAALYEDEDPERGWRRLRKIHEGDVRKVHRGRRGWKKAEFLGFELGTPPRWIAPGKDGNKVGFHRSYRGKLRFSAGGRERTVSVHTLVGWQGRWYVTHLSRMR